MYAKVLGFLVIALGLVVHAFSALIGYVYSGFEGLLITVLLPVVAEVFWFIKLWSDVGPSNNFTYVLVVYVIVIALLSFEEVRQG